MYKVLLVDDEPRAIKTMSYIVDWKQIGFVIVGHAANGKQAMEMVAEYKDISLLITDIKMPIMDGIELIQEVRKKSDMPIIIMSGYDDFEYAKKCFQYGVKDYFLKPVSETEVLQVLQTVKNELDSRDQLKRQLRIGLSALQDNLMRKWSHSYLKREELEPFLEQKGKKMEEQQACVLLVEMDFMEEYDTSRTKSEIDLKRFAVRNVMEEVLAGHGLVYEETVERYGAVLFNEWNDDLEAQIYHQAQELQHKITRYTKVQVTVGIGVCVTEWDRLAVSFQTACHALEKKYFMGMHTVIPASSYRKQVSNEELFMLQDVAAILNEIKQGNEKGFKALLERQCAQMIQMETPKEIVQSLVLSLCVQGYELLLQYSGSNVDQFLPNHKDYEEITNAKTIVQLFEFAVRKCSETMEQLKQNSHSQSLQTIIQVKQWVQAQYTSNISLKSIAEFLFVNATYLGQQFKSVEGITFNDYLLKVRMEKAKDLLQHTNLRIYEIAVQVGYQELDWFYRRFKEYTGMSTTKYRMAVRNEVEPN
ncbi:YesN/AraC family two-component response regulator [Paenibacillus castaneae]|uniref:response regulator transcription factor n=1 Tax=Paenibacillus castaneae TaxID=474957 RepID=UPI00141AAA67|nr:response regulator [Paenibacillus castaneae]NIK75901.1 YesN/AraC family two-component response regulator [Paenibacillus castaneae]